MFDVKRLREMVKASLEQARVEVARRLKSTGLPLSLVQRQLVAKYKEDGTGSGSEWVAVQVSGLRSDEALMSIRDDSVPHVPLGLRPQLGDLAEYLAQHTDLGAKHSVGMFPSAEGVDGVLLRCVVPLALHYLLELQDVGSPDEELADQLASELVELVAGEHRLHIRQLTLIGIRPKEHLSYRDVGLRPLNPLERGAIWENDFQTRMRQPRTGERGYLLPNPSLMHVPDSVLEVKTSRLPTEIQDQSRLIHRVVLAFFLSDYSIKGFGDVVGFDHPIWASGGSVRSPLPLLRWPRESKEIDSEAFTRIVDLAYRIPEFTTQESSQLEIALDRVLKAYGAQSNAGGFLDFVIALEAMLLKNIRRELSYRFSLYGALFLREELNAKETFKRLRSIYEVRSSIVHGSPVDQDDRIRAVDDAVDLTTRILRRAIQTDWPSPVVLDALALAAPIKLG